MNKFSVLILALSFTLIINAEYYIIYNGNDRVGYYRIDEDQMEIREYALWNDGFSSEYSECLHSNFPDYTYKAYSYYSNNQVPKITEYKYNKLKKEISGITCLYQCGNIDAVFSGVLPVYSLMMAYRGKAVLNANTARIAKTSLSSIDNIKYSIFGSGFFPDSMYFHNYRFIRTDKILSISNPYSVRKTRILTPGDFRQKTSHIRVEGKRYLGELAFTKKSDTVIMILPFDQFSNRYGNIPPHIMPYTTYQIAERLKYPTFIFEFKDYGPIEHAYDFMQNGIIEAYKYLNQRYKQIIIMTFGPMLPLFLSTGIERPVIAVNPPAVHYEDYAKSLWGKLKTGFIFSSFDAYRNYDPLYANLSKTDLSKLYSNGDIYFVISRMTASDEAVRQAKTSGMYSIINNVDTRLNSYIVNEDFWSYKTHPYIHSKVIDHLNSISDKILKRRGL